MAKLLVNLSFVILVSFFVFSSTTGIPFSEYGNSKAFDEAGAAEYVTGYYEQEASRLCNLAAVAEFEFETNLGSQEAEDKKNAASIAYAEFELNEYRDNISQFDHENFADKDLQRQFKFLRAIGTSPLDSADLTKYNDVLSKMNKIYGEAKICPYTNNACDLTAEGLSLEPDITNLLGEMNNFNEMAYVWKAWRDTTGKNMRSLFNEYVDLSNKAAKANGEANMGDFWLLRYETDPAVFRKEMDDVWQKVKTELYEPLYNFVRDRLSKKFPQMDPKSAMPAHVFGNMWAQSWEYTLPWVKPYPNAPAFDVTQPLKDMTSYYDGELAKRIVLFDMASIFFTSLGLEPMKMAYGNDAMIMKPTDKEVICHASAWDMCDKSDFRLKMCTEINHEDFITIHHELGHIQYYLQYKNLPITYRTGANPGFHEAIGDVIALSASTPLHLYKVGLLPDDNVSDQSTLNYLMQMALDKIAFLPFGYLIDSYRWDVFDDTIPRTNLTYNWIKKRAEIQGIIPPFKRNEDDFDAGAKYHVPGNTPYIRYFVSYILQFQIHKRLCEEAGQGGPLHTCDIYQNKAAGILFKKLLESGASKNWKELLMEITGEDKLNPDAIISYFKPLIDHLKIVEATENYPKGWDGVDINNYFGDGELVTPTEPTTTTTTTTTTTPATTTTLDSSGSTAAEDTTPPTPTTPTVTDTALPFTTTTTTPSTTTTATTTTTTTPAKTTTLDSSGSSTVVDTAPPTPTTPPVTEDPASRPTTENILSSTSTASNDHKTSFAAVIVGAVLAAAVM